LVETAAPRGEVIKLLPPLTIGEDELAGGVRRLGAAVREVG
jgi:diaminobutyrate-2-oxoglutarate transaminase